MYKLKKLDARGIPAALAKAERYRLLNEAREAESICRDILETDPAGQGRTGGAVALLILALTDQFGGHSRRGTVTPDTALALIGAMESPYDRAYLSGIICERWAKAEFARDADRTAGPHIFEWLTRAMDFFEEAEAIAPAANQDAVLRWNSCVRMMERNSDLRPRLAPVSSRQI
jgi:hypothetical protein